jgi:hypothetical protein
VSSYSVKRMTRMLFHFAPGVERCGTHVGPDPADELVHPGVRQCAAGLGKFSHLLQEILLLGKQLTSGVGIGPIQQWRRSPRRLPPLLRLPIPFPKAMPGRHPIRVPRPSILDTIARNHRGTGPLVTWQSLPLSQDRLPVNTQCPREGFYRRKEALLEPAD